MRKNSHSLTENSTIKSKISRGDSTVSKMPKATPEQLTLAKLLNTTMDEAESQQRITKVQECIGCTAERAISALHDSNNDVQLAIEALLDPNVDEGWQMTSHKKSKSRRATEQTIKTKSSEEITSGLQKDNHESVQDGEHQEVSAQATQEVCSPVTGLVFQTVKGRVSRRSGNKIQSSQFVPNDVEDSALADIKMDSAKLKSDSGSDIQSPKQNRNSWSEECGEWKGEAIEIVNSTSTFSVNIHEDMELLKLATTEPEEVAIVESRQVATPESVKHIPEELYVPEPIVETIHPVDTLKDEKESINFVKSHLFAKFATSSTPEASSIPNMAVFFAPNAKATHTLENPYSFGVVQAPVATTHEHVIQVNSASQSSEKIKIDSLDRKPKQSQPLYETGEDLHINPPNQGNYTPTASSIIPPVPKPQPVSELPSGRAYSSALQNVSVLQDAFAKLKEPESPQTRAPANSFDPADSFNTYLLDELSQNMNKANIDVRSNKTDAFTQSLSSNQTDTVSQPYHSVKPPASQPQVGKPLSNMPPNTNQQSMPTTQSHPQMHPNMHPSMPQILSQFQAALPMFNLHGTTGAGPQLVDLDQFQVLQQQRFLYEMQQQLQQSQANTTESSMVNNISDVMPSSKSTAPMGHLPTANTGVRPDFLASTMNHQMMNPAAAASFLSYPGLVLMNGYANPFMNQQQASQPSGSQSQSSGHGGSPLAQHQSAQQQYNKGMNSAANYQNYQNLRPSNFEDLNDLSYQNLKQIGYKHNGSQSVYGSQQGQSNSDMTSLSNKLQQQQQSVSMPQNLGGSQPQQQSTQQQQQQQVTSQYQHSTGGGPANPFTLYHQQYMALAAAAAAAQQQQQQQQHSISNASSVGGGSSGGVPGGGIGSGIHGNPAMALTGGQSVMHHQRP